MKHLHITNSTDQVVQPDKYVQAVGLFISGFHKLKKAADPTLNESSPFLVSPAGMVETPRLQAKRSAW